MRAQLVRVKCGTHQKRKTASEPSRERDTPLLAFFNHNTPSLWRFPPRHGSFLPLGARGRAYRDLLVRDFFCSAWPLHSEVFFLLPPFLCNVSFNYKDILDDALSIRSRKWASTFRMWIQDVRTLEGFFSVFNHRILTLYGVLFLLWFGSRLRKACAFCIL